MNRLNHPHFAEALKIRDVRFFISSVGFYALASRSLNVVLGFQIYQLTHSVLALGWLGFFEAIPAICLVFFGGYVADHFDRRKIILVARASFIVCAVVMALFSLQNHTGTAVAGLYAMIFLAGIARGFADPANTAFESQIVPKPLTVNAYSWITSTWLVCAVLGPASIGFIFDAWGAVGSYICVSVCFVLSWISTACIAPKPKPVQEKREPIWQSLSSGWSFVFKNEPLLGALALDLFAVLFGGAVALLPVYAKDILQVGAKGLGFLNAAPFMGSIVVTLLATRFAPIRRAGRNLLLAVAGFGVSIFIFAFSKNFWLSMAMLFLSGMFDGVSVVIRRSMVRLLSPEHLRGRIAAANWIFISASNELGAFESGLVASWIGTVPCVAVGGFLTLCIVVLTAIMARQLRQLRLDSFYFS